MFALDDDLQRALAVRALRGNLLRLKWHAAALRFELALRRYDRALKYGYHPDQPRVPAGVPEGGQWTTVYCGYSPSNRDKNPVATPHKETRVAADNQRQNKMVRDIAVQLKLTRDQADQLHRAISKQGFGYHEILQIAKDMFNK